MQYLHYAIASYVDYNYMFVRSCCLVFSSFVIISSVCFFGHCSLFCIVFYRLYTISLTCFLQGMQYLHSVDIKFHGHLTSSNCVVDSRWILKITDHGLREFKSPSEQLSVRGRDYQVNCSSMVWNHFNLLENSNFHRKIQCNNRLFTLHHLQWNHSLSNTLIIFTVIKIILDKNYDTTVFTEVSKVICVCFNLVLHYWVVFLNQSDACWRFPVFKPCLRVFDWFTGLSVSLELTKWSWLYDT